MRTRAASGLGRGLCAAMLAACGAGPIPEETPEDLAAAAEQVLRANCFRCHGQNGSASGGFNYMLDVERLVATRKIVPRDPEGSYLLQRIVRGEMPPPGQSPRPGPEDVRVLEQWILAGAPPFGPAPQALSGFIPPADAVRAMDRDIVGMPFPDRRFTRYFVLTHLRNAGLPEEELDVYRAALSKLVNSLSWSYGIAVPAPVDAARTVYRIDLRDYDWARDEFDVWERLVDVYPYGVADGVEASVALYREAGTRLPYLRADWFVAAASRAPLYHDILALPATAGELERMLFVDAARNIAQGRVARAGFNDSGVALHNRVIERHPASYGAYWKSYDFADNLGRRDIFSHPLGPGGGASEFQHDGGEIIFSLPNGLQGYLLANAAGDRLDRAPLAIVADPARPEKAVETAVSCMSCHARGMLRKDDQVRAHVEANHDAFSGGEALEVEALYPRKDEMDALFAADEARFAAARAATGTPEGVDPVVGQVLQFEGSLDLRRAAAEAGMGTVAFLGALDALPEFVVRALGPLRIPGGTVKREVYEHAFPHLACLGGGGTYLPQRGAPDCAALANQAENL